MTTTLHSDIDHGVTVDHTTPATTHDTGQTRAERSRRTAVALERASHVKGQDRQLLLDEAIWLNLPVARSLAARYRDRGQPREDLEQVAFLALTRAAQGFEPAQGKNFLVYAVPTITGELKRHFRDATWAVRPPRRLQEMQGTLAGTRQELTQELGRTPSAGELARRIGCTTAEAVEALGTDDCYRPASLEDRGVDGDGPALGDALGAEERGYERAEAIAMLGPVCRHLGPRDRRIVFLRFYEQWSQQRIAEEIGVTQMQVSRLLTRILGTLREQLEPAEPTPDPGLTAA
ncbi:sigma-70 family RNA polymerase sigma factor [Nocardioides panacisoli]|uniref:sigma-70 family RNA polymerase sigma factor n=1 Tax=Nocardioides panacisoli TaxID=627624 RepID=UPI001C634D3A|nr:sigma-70 family RNA polymerase sigma factor [Nocardioides panacisoli]QYJ02803.1 sigma-70 family RNA polymerase sigma factor [Nocardioides panacisoli]